MEFSHSSQPFGTSVSHGRVRCCPTSILRSYKNGEYTDLTIVCGEHTFNVHKVVVCSASKFFKNSIKFPGEEAERNRINLPEDDPEMIRRVIAYLYLGDYDPNNGNDVEIFDQIKQHDDNTTRTNHTHHYRRQVFGGFSPSTTTQCACLSPNRTNVSQPMAKVEPTGNSTTYTMTEKASNVVEVLEPMTIHATMYALGDKYQIAGLSKLATEKFKSCLHHHAHTKDFAAAVQIAYSSTPDSNRGLRDAVLYAFRTQFKVDITRIPGAEAKLDTIDELSFLLIQSWPTKMEPEKPAQVRSSNLFGSSSGGGGFFGGALPPKSSGVGASQPPVARPIFQGPSTAGTTSTSFAPTATGSVFGTSRP